MGERARERESGSDAWNKQGLSGGWLRSRLRGAGPWAQATQHQQTYQRWSHRAACLQKAKGAWMVISSSLMCP